MGKLGRRFSWGLGAIALAIAFLFYGVSSLARPGKLTVDNGQLMEHVQRLATERYQDLALARTRAYLTQALTTYGYEPMTQAFGSGESAGTNLSIVRPGTQTPGQKILVGAHYDSAAGSPGADDNASAVATALEVARIFSDYPTEKTLQVVFFDQEELQPEGAGLLGSNAFVNEAPNLEGLEGAVILEMVGYACYEPGCQRYPAGLEQQNLPDRGDFIGVVGDTDHPELLAAFASDGKTDSETLKVLTLPVPIGALPFMPDLFRSDHAPFWLKGVGAVMVTDTANFRNPHYHRSTDTVETLDRVFLGKTAQYVVERVAQLLANS